MKSSKPNPSRRLGRGVGTYGPGMVLGLYDCQNNRIVINGEFSLPDESGWDVLRRLASEPKSLRLVSILSGLTIPSQSRCDDVMNDILDWYAKWTEEAGPLVANLRCLRKIVAVWICGLVMDIPRKVSEVARYLRIL